MVLAGLRPSVIMAKTPQNDIEANTVAGMSLNWHALKWQELTCATRGGSVSRPLEPKEAGSREMMDTAKGIVFWLLMISAATASRGGNRNSLACTQPDTAKTPLRVPACHRVERNFTHHPHACTCCRWCNSTYIRFPAAYSHVANPF